MNTTTSQVGRLYWNQNNELNPVLEDLFGKILPILGFLPPWDFWLQYLAFAFKDGAGKKFNQIQRGGQRVEGFIIGKWDKGGRLVEYLSSYSRFGGYFRLFNDDTEAILPLMYKTLRGAMDTIRKLPEGVDYDGEKLLKEERIGLAFWLHPEATDMRLEKYLCLIGHQFPGSPRQ